MIRLKEFTNKKYKLSYSSICQKKLLSEEDFNKYMSDSKRSFYEKFQITDEYREYLQLKKDIEVYNLILGAQRRIDSQKAMGYDPDPIDVTYLDQMLKANDRIVKKFRYECYDKTWIEE